MTAAELRLLLNEINRALDPQGGVDRGKLLETLESLGFTREIGVFELAAQVIEQQLHGIETGLPVKPLSDVIKEAQAKMDLEKAKPLPRETRGEELRKESLVSARRVASLSVSSQKPEENISVPERKTKYVPGVGPVTTGFISEEAKYQAVAKEKIQEKIRETQKEMGVVDIARRPGSLIPPILRRFISQFQKAEPVEQKISVEVPEIPKIISAKVAEKVSERAEDIGLKPLKINPRDFFTAIKIAFVREIIDRFFGKKESTPAAVSNSKEFQNRFFLAITRGIRLVQPAAERLTANVVPRIRGVIRSATGFVSSTQWGEVFSKTISGFFESSFRVLKLGARDVPVALGLMAILMLAGISSVLFVLTSGFANFTEITVGSDIPPQPVEISKTASVYSLANEDLIDKPQTITYTIAVKNNEPVASQTVVDTVTIMKKDGSLEKKVLTGTNFIVPQGLQDAVIINSVTVEGKTTKGAPYKNTASATTVIGNAPVAAFSCPVIGGAIACVSQNGTGANCRHCDEAYKQNWGKACQFPGNYSAVDVAGQLNAPVYLPSVYGQAVNWIYNKTGTDDYQQVYREFKSANRNYTLQLHHLQANGNLDAGLKNKELPQGTIVGNLAPFPSGVSSPHSHIQLSVGGSWVAAETVLCK